MDEEDKADVMEAIDDVQQKVDRLDSRLWLFAIAWSVIGGIWLFRHW